MLLGQLPNLVQEGSGVKRDGTQMVTEGSLTKGLPHFHGGGRGSEQATREAAVRRGHLPSLGLEEQEEGASPRVEGESPRGRLPGVWPPAEELSPPREGLGGSGPTSFSLTSSLCCLLN